MYIPGPMHERAVVDGWLGCIPERVEIGFGKSNFAPHSCTLALTFVVLSWPLYLNADPSSAKYPEGTGALPG